ncbi:zinc-binding dehydrogenase [Streptomyces sp. NPDC002644]
MQAVYAAHPSSGDPLSALRHGPQPPPRPPAPDWTVVCVEAAALNHHDLWTLRGDGLPAHRFPMILGCDAVGTDEDGRRVIVHGLISDAAWAHDPIRDPRHTVLSEGYPGTFAEFVAVPRRCLHPYPQEYFSAAEAACLPATWLTAYRMLFTKSGLRPGDTVLVQGAGGGMSEALIQLASAAGFRVWATSRSPAKREAARALGAETTFPTGAPLPAPVDAVMESVGRATWSHSLRALRPGGTVVVTGATTGADPPALLNRIFWQELRVLGSTSGSPGELDHLVTFMRRKRLKPTVSLQLPFARAVEGFRAMERGELTGKVVFHWPDGGDDHGGDDSSR